MNESYKVKVGEFEGPLDLLLSLIEKRKLCINDISLAEVTDGYLEYVKSIENFPIAYTANFLIVASSLILIKSLSLLPSINLTPEETESLEDLENRLRIYKDIKEKSTYLKERFGKNCIFWGGLKNKLNIFTPTPEITLTSVHETLKNLLECLPKEEKLPEAVIKKVISLDEAITDLISRIQKNFKMNFSELTKGSGGNNTKITREVKTNLIVNFLAILELVKRGVIMAEQGSHFSEINLESSECSTPRY